jgi:hypothetical protein
MGKAARAKARAAAAQEVESKDMFVSKDVIMEPVTQNGDKKDAKDVKDVILEPVAKDVKDVILEPVAKDVKEKVMGHVESIVEIIEEKVMGKSKGKGVEGKGTGKSFGAGSYKDVVMGSSSSSSKGTKDKSAKDRGDGKGKGKDMEDKEDKDKGTEDKEDEDKGEGDWPNYENEKKGVLGKVPCDRCGKEVKWSKIFSQRDWINWEEDEYRWWRWCASCCAKDWDCTEKEALAQILEDSG